MMLRPPQIHRAAADEAPARWVLACCGVLLFVHLVLLGFFQVSSLDTWFHLKEGELYVTTWSLPSQDPFAFTTAGRDWIKYSWLADVVFYVVYAATGFPGLVLVRLGSLLAIAWLLYRILRGCKLNPVAAILLSSSHSCCFSGRSRCSSGFPSLRRGWRTRSFPFSSCG
jgi:hypothetical protein